MAILRRRLDDGDVRRLARGLADELAPFAPEVVIHLERGGRPVGEEIADRLGVPGAGLAVSYGASGQLGRLPQVVRALLWPAKEALYRLSPPRARGPLPSLEGIRRVALVDDTASTGRSVALALELLRRAGVVRSAVRVAVIRCGPQARWLVDHHALSERVLLSR